jgi:hypothetical protein
MRKHAPTCSQVGFFVVSKTMLFLRNSKYDDPYKKKQKIMTEIFTE